MLRIKSKEPQQIARMEKETFQKWIQELRPKIMQVGLNFFGNTDDAEDAAQETLISLWRYCERIDENRNIEALAIRVAKNSCVNLKRKQMQMTYSDESCLINIPPLLSPSPQEEMEREEENVALQKAIGMLNPRERTLFEMRQMEGLETEEISRQTGIPKASVQSMISAARKKVFNELKRRMNL